MQKLMRMMHKNEKGFTLVELMVVVVIIGVLVAIAIPIYGTITESAAESAHEANIRTIKGAIQMYRAANDGALPSATTDLAPDYLEVWPTPPSDLSAAIEADHANWDHYDGTIYTHTK